MIGFSPFRNLHSVMAVTLHVAITSFLIRSMATPTTLAGSFTIWVPLSILLAVFFSWPMGRAISKIFDPVDVLGDRRCPRCARGELRPLLRAGAGLFQPLSGYRCSACRSTFRPVGDVIVEEPASIAPASEAPEGIRFLDESADESEIRFLEPTPPVANIVAGPVSEIDRPIMRTDRVEKGWVEDGDQGRICGTAGAGGALPVADSPVVP